MQKRSDCKWMAAALMAGLAFSGAMCQGALVDAFRGAPVFVPPTDTRTDTFPQAGWGFAAGSNAAPPGTKQVNQLGFWVSPADSGNTGVLAANHEIRLYHYNGSGYDLLADAIVIAGLSGDANQYAWVSIPTVTLSDTSAGGDFYIVTATMDTDVWGPFTGVSGTPVLDTTFGTPTGNSWFSAPATTGFSSHSANGGYFGANIGFDNPVPEPASLALLASGGLLLLRRRKSA